MGTFLQRRPLGRHPGQGRFDYVDGRRAAELEKSVVGVSGVGRRCWTTPSGCTPSDRHFPRCR